MSADPRTDPPTPDPLTVEEECGALGLCGLPKGHAQKLHSTSVDRAAALDATHGYIVFEGPNGELMRTPYRAAALPSAPDRRLREALDDIEDDANWLHDHAPDYTPDGVATLKDVARQIAKTAFIARAALSEATTSPEPTLDVERPR